jgi:serine/threonine-protein kinase HipA
METNNFSYENLLVMTQQLTRDMSQVKDMYKRMVLNIVGANCDDHLKNISYTMAKDGTWSLSPLYDVLYNTGPATFGEHFLSVNKKDKEITKEDLVKAADVVNISTRDANCYIEEVVDNFNDTLNNIQEYHLELHLVQELRNKIHTFGTFK